MSDTPNPPPSQPTPPPGGSPPPAQPGVPISPPGMELTPEAADVEKNKVFAIFSYLGILVLIPILAAKDSPFAKFHANQGLLLFLAEIAISVLLTCAGIIFPHIPVLGTIAWCMTCVIYPVVCLAFLAFAIMGIINAANGKMKLLPGFPPITLIK